VKLLLLIPLLCGCSISKFNQPPTWASLVDAKARFYGLDASIPIGNGMTIGVKLGAGSTTYTVIPVSTNQVFIPKFSDTLSLGQTINPFDTTIREYLQAGWEGPTPPPAMMIFTRPPVWTNAVLSVTNTPLQQ
jgi:hypothetical protein